MKLRFEATVEAACLDAYDVMLNDALVGTLHLELRIVFDTATHAQLPTQIWFLYQPERARVAIAGNVREDVAQKCVRAYLLGTGLDVHLW